MSHPPRPSRRLCARLSLGLLIGLCLSNLACANRGMSRNSTGTGGMDGTGGTDGGGTGGNGSGGSGTGGSGGASPIEPGPDLAPADTRDADPVDVRDASVDHPCTPTATFTFDNGLQNAALFGAPNAVTMIVNSTTNRYCGARSLELMTTFGGVVDGGTVNRGGIQIPLTGAQQNLSGKTLTIHVSAVPDGTASTYVAVTLATPTRPVTLLPNTRPVTGDWSTSTYSLTMATDAGVTTATALSIEIFDNNSYSGSIFIDDVDLR